MKERSIRAVYDDQTITVYQAFNRRIAQTAVEHQTFISPPFKMERMTWIKPSFLWMMYRSGWALKEKDKQILSIKITRKGFEDALRMSCLSTYQEDVHQNKENWKSKLTESPVRIQWDPERNIQLEALNYRAIQVGLSGVAVSKYLKEWIVSVQNITEFVNEIYQLSNSNIDQAMLSLPKEMLYPVSTDVQDILGMKS